MNTMKIKSSDTVIVTDILKIIFNINHTIPIISMVFQIFSKCYSNTRNYV